MSKKSKTEQQEETDENKVEFSFLELDKYLAANDNNFANNSSQNKSNKKSKKPLNKEPENPSQKLRIKPNSTLAKNQTPDDLIYQNTEKIKKEEPIKEEIKEIVIPKTEQKRERPDKRIVTINLEKIKNENKSEKKDEAEKNLGDDNEIKEIDNKPCEIDTLINNIKKKDPKALIPIMLPFGQDENKNEKTLKEELLTEDKLFIFQFPRQIPINNLNCQTKTKEEENVNEEPNYDENGYLMTPEFKNSFQEIKENNLNIGKLILFKNGKVKLKIGNIYFDINEGSKAKFAQETVVIPSNEDKQAYLLGSPLNKKFIVTPEFD